MELIKPSKMDVNVQENDGRKGVLVAEPLERGFGLTLGNAIRRVYYLLCKVLLLHRLR
jgi:DNA-directed RNA polymerase subunit alpha